MPRTVVYIDAANIILSAKNHNIDIDVLKLVQHLKDTFRSKKILYFTGNFESKKGVFSSLKEAGVELVYKEIYNENNKTKANCDVEISHRMTADILRGQMEKIVAISGDGDFVHLYDFARAQNIEVKVLAFDPKSCSRVIKKRQFTKISYLIELGKMLENEKPPAST